LARKGNGFTEVDISNKKGPGIEKHRVGERSKDGSKGKRSQKVRRRKENACNSNVRKRHLLPAKKRKQRSTTSGGRKGAH